MTADELIQAVKTLKPIAFAEAVAKLTEAERKKLSKTAQQLLADARPKKRETFDWPTTMKLMARLAVLAVCAKTAAVRVNNLTNFPNDGVTAEIVAMFRGDKPVPFVEAAIQILIDRRPDWADDWLATQLSPQFPEITWQSVRRLIDSGVCRKPTSPGYVRLFATVGMTIDFEVEPKLLDDVWDLFRVDAGVFTWTQEVKKVDRELWRSSLRDGKHPYSHWPRILFHYSHKGLIDRNRLLDETLAALWRDEFNSNSRTGLMRLYELLDPQPIELAERERAYLELLRNPAAAVVGFGLQMLKALQKSDAAALDGAAFIEAVPSVLTVSAKSHPLAALSMLKSVVKQRPDLAASAARTAVRGLTHESADVQDAALTLLEAWSPQPDSLPVSELAEVREFVSSRLRERLDTLIRAAGHSTPEAERATTSAPSSAVSVETRLAELHERANQLTAESRAACGVDSALEAAASGRLPPPFDFDRPRRVLVGLQPVEPICDLDELIDAVAHALEVIDSPIEVERIIDGICRLSGERPPDFEARTEALVQRLTAEPRFEMSRGLQVITFLLPSLSSLVKDWLAGRFHDESQPNWFTKLLSVVTPAYGRSESPIQRLLNDRLTQLKQRLKNGHCGWLLSLPTHEHGWIDPRVFVTRLRADLANSAGVNRSDLIFGLLRLAPDFGDQAIAQSRGLGEPYGRIVRYALGGDDHPSRLDRDWAAEWLAAGRARSPRGSLPELACLDLPDAPNCVEPAQLILSESFGKYELRSHISLGGKSGGSFIVQPPLTDNVSAEQHPTVVLLQQVGEWSVFGSFSGWAEEWVATIWPSNPDASLATGIDRLLLRIDEAGSTWFHMASALQPLLAAERGWSHTALISLWLGLVGRDAEARAVARDALVEGVQDGRAHPEPLSDVLLELAERDWFKLNRLAESLRGVARVSPWGALLVAEILDRVIASWQTPPRDAHHVLELQLELLIELDRELSETARPVLAGLSGSTKTAKLARKLCDCRSGSGTTSLQAILEAVDSRITRAERLAAFS